MNEDRKVFIGGKEYLYPDWTFKPIQRIMNLMREMSEADSNDRMDYVPRIISAALIRVYPELTPDFIGEWMLPEEAEVLDRIAAEQIEKITKKKIAEMSQPEMNQSTGEDSTPELSPSQDGLGNT